MHRDRRRRVRDAVLEPFFKTFTEREICDTTTHVEALLTVSCESRAEVDELVKIAVANGGKRAGGPQDHGFMYDWGFYDLDGTAGGSRGWTRAPRRRNARRRVRRDGALSSRGPSRSVRRGRACGALKNWAPLSFPTDMRSTERPAVRHRRVLVVDDSPAIRQPLQRILQADGLVVDCAARVAEGLRLVATRRPHLVILDMQLAGENGRALLRLLVARFGALAPPVIVCSGRGGELPPGAVGRLAKPFFPSDVLAAVHKFARRETVVPAR